MTNFDKFHEKEQVILKSKTLHTLDELRKFLFTLSFQEMDDFFFLTRSNKTQWQSINLTDVVVYKDNKQLDLFEETTWNQLKLDYLFATLPFECVDQFIDICLKIALRFNLSIEHKNKVCNKNKLITTLYEYREDVIAELGDEPGSKIVKINILQTYPRSK